MPLPSLRLVLLASAVACAAVPAAAKAQNVTPNVTQDTRDFTPVGGGIPDAEMAAIRADLARATTPSVPPSQPARPTPVQAVSAAAPGADEGAGASPVAHDVAVAKQAVATAVDLPNASGDPSKPTDVQLYDEKQRPYYYDHNHEFHPGTVPKPGPNLNRDPFTGNGRMTFADDAHTSGGIESDVGGTNDVMAGAPDGQGGPAGNGGANGGGQPAAPTDSSGRPMVAYNGGDPREDRKAELDEVLNHLLPPDNAILELRRRQAAAQKADVAPLQEVKPVIRTLNMTLAPGETPPVIHLSYGDTTSLTFSDIAGKPWYVNRVDADKIAYATISSSGEDTTRTNIVTIDPKKTFSQGRNLTVFLDHLPVPVIFQLETGMSHDVDYRVDVSIRHRGPLTHDAPVEQGIAPPQDKVMQDFVDGITPDHAVKLRTSNQGVEAWRLGRVMYIRSAMPLRGPHYTKRSQSNIDGLVVYEVQYTPDITISDDGELVPVRIGGK